MKAYRIVRPDNGQARFERTQADAKRTAKLDDATFEQVEIPTDQQGLIIFLNDLAAEQRSLGRLTGQRLAENAERISASAPVPLNIAANHQVGQSQEAFTATEIEDFILNRATVAQVENIFAVLGTRFAEKRRVA
jgi:hypothetical protein